MTDIVERLRRAVNIYEITTLLANDAAAYRGGWKVSNVETGGGIELSYQRTRVAAINAARDELLTKTQADYAAAVRRIGRINPEAVK